MSEIIERWLGKHTGIFVKMDSDSVGDFFYDGLVFAKLLVSFNVCNSKYLNNLCTQLSESGALKNLRKLCVWFKLLGVSHGESFLQEIASKNRSSCLRLLYELFVVLENKERMIFINDQKGKRLLSESGGRFEVTRVSEIPNKEPDKKSEDWQFMPNLEERHKHIVESYDNLEKSFIEKCIADSLKRRKAIQKLSGKKEVIKQVNMEKSVPCKPCEINAMEEIRNFEKKLKDSHRAENNEDVINCTPAEFVSLLKIRRRKSEADKYLKSKMERAVLYDSWKNILKNEEKEFLEALSKKFLKQSDFEKQMTLRLSRINLLYKKFKDNRRMIYDTLDVENFDVTNVETGKEETKNYCEEKAKVLELHKKLFQEKMNIKRKNNYTSCWIILEDIVDLSMLMSDFENEFKMKITKDILKYKEWKVLFCKGIRLLDHPQISPHKSSDLEIEKKIDDYEDLIELDPEKMEIIAENEFDMYLHLSGDWEVNKATEIPPGFEKYFTNLPRWKDFALIPQKENLNMLGYIIHRLLDMKYQYNVPQRPSDFDNFDKKVLLTSINDSIAISKLKMLLNKSKICVIEVPSAINYVTGVYKEAAGIVDVKETVKKRLAKRERNDSVTRKVESKLDKKLNFKSKIFSPPPVEKGVRDVEVQFPSETSISDKNSLKQAIYLGNCTYNLLVKGNKLPDVLICEIITEYIKSLKKVNGWVLINYPETLIQIAVLEFLFSKNEVPFMPIITSNIQNYIEEEMKTISPINKTQDTEVVSLGKEEEQEEEEQQQQQQQQYSEESSFFRWQSTTNGNMQYLPIKKIKELKNSSILPKPFPESSPPDFKSCFTKVIEIIPENKPPSKETFSDNVESQNEEEDSETFELNLHNFYTSIGLTSTMTYNKSYNISTLKNLARLILDETTDLRPKDSVELFGAEVLDALDKNRKLKQGITNKSLTNKLAVASIKKRYSLVSQGKSHGSSFYCDFGEMIEEETPEGEEEEEQESVIFDKYLDTPHPGLPNWIYTNFPIQEEFQIPLATVWEVTEFFYVYNMKEVLGIINSVDSKVLYYRQHVLKKLEQCLTFKDQRKQITINFQLMLNGIDNELRSLKSLKGELHCRVFELQNALEDMTLKKKAFSETTREILINEEWLPEQLIKLIHSYRCLLQVEVDRYIDTMQIVQDYHMLCLGKLPSDFRLTKLIVPNIIWKEEANDDNSIRVPHITSASGINAYGLRPLRKHSTTIRKKNFKDHAQEEIDDKIMQMQNDTVEIKEQPHFFRKEFQNSISELLKLSSIEENLMFSAHFIWQNIIDPLFDMLDNVKLICISKLNKEDEKRKIKEKKDLKEYTESDRLFLEWEEALIEEHERCVFRLQLILVYVVSVLRNQLLIVHSAFNEFDRDVSRQFVKEMSDIAKVCDILKIAIEEEKSIQPILILEPDGFYVDPNIILFPEIPPPPPTAIKEQPSDHRFTIAQLTNFYNKMLHVAPEGIIEQPFIHILEDMALMGHESGHFYLPSAWSELSSEDIKKILHYAFGENFIINWRDFIIYGLDIQFPCLEEILHLRENFREFDPELTEVVSYNDYMRTVLWFEIYIVNSICENLRLAKIKDLLFKLFQISKSEINYSALLLAFCKDEDPRKGFTKALGLVDGFKYISREEDLLLKPKVIEQEREQAVRIAYEVVLDILNRVFHIVDDVIITDIEDDSTFFNTMQEQFELDQLILHYGCMKSSSVVENKDHQEESKGREEEDQVPWHMEVSYDNVLSLLLIADHYYALSSEHTLEQTNLEENLRKIFNEMGNNDIMKLHVLLDTPFMKDYFKFFHTFQSNSLRNLVASLCSSKNTILTFKK